MSNRVCITRTKFENLVDGTVTYGYRMYDDYANAYDNLYFEESAIMTMTELELLEQVVKNYSYLNHPIKGMLDYLSESEKGISIDEEYFEYEDIKHIIG